jgi:tetratricopeptide (TPR) repeat protein
MIYTPKIGAFAAFAVLVLSVPGPASAQTAASAQDVQNCQTSQNTSIITSACTRVAQDTKQPVATRTIAYYMLGNDEASQNNFDQSIQFFTQAVALEPAPQVLSARALAYLGRAQVNNTPADLDSAIKDLTQAITENGKQPDPTDYFYRGVAYVGKNDGPDAIKDFNKALSLSTGTIPSIMYNEMGYAYFINKDYADALKNYNKAITVDPDNKGLDGSSAAKAIVITATTSDAVLQDESDWVGQNYQGFTWGVTDAGASGGRTYNQATLKAPDGTSTTLYFDITALGATANKK